MTLKIEVFKASEYFRNIFHLLSFYVTDGITYLTFIGTNMIPLNSMEKKKILLSI